MTVSSVGQADDAVLLSSEFHNISNLLKLTTEYCAKYGVEMGPEKTKLLVFSPHSIDSYSEYYKLCNYLEINGVPIKFVNSAEHVRVTSSVLGKPSTYPPSHCLSQKSSRLSSLF